MSLILFLGFLAYPCQFQIPVPNGFVVTSAEEARDVVSNICESRDLFHLRHASGCVCLRKVAAPSVLKAQVLAGGRGKGKYDSDGKGGVRIVTW
jgi:succinyl-CoA synthetase beta subunit